MSQGKLVGVEKVKKGFKLTFLDYENNEISGIYDNDYLKEDELKKLIGHSISFSDKKDISFSGKKEDKEIDIHKIWEPSGRVRFCDDPKDGFDR